VQYIRIVVEESEDVEGRTKMTDKVIENNRVTIVGEVVSEFEFSHEVYGEGFYTLNISVNRLSDSVDIIPLMISERLVDVTEDLRGVIIEASGQFRSYNRHEENKNRLMLSIFVRELQLYDNYEEENSTNQIFLDGYICKPAIYRRTPLGREIADVLIAVNRPYGKSDYIPCIAWGRNARFAAGFEVGSHIQIYGRIQSREYVKKISEDECERRTAYEVSVSKIEYFEE
jgi:single-stranded DNA-binding protein